MINKILIKEQSLVFLFVFITTAFTYFFRDFYEPYFNLIKILIVLLSIIFVAFTLKFKKPLDKFSLLLLLLILCFSISCLFGIIYNGFEYTIPTYLRYVLVFLFIILGQNISFEKNDKTIKIINHTLLLITFISSLYQFLMGDLVLKTSVYRLSGFYGDNTSGFGLLCSTLFIINLYLLKKYKRKIKFGVRK